MLPAQLKKLSTIVAALSEHPDNEGASTKQLTMTQMPCRAIGNIILAMPHLKAGKLS